MATPWTPASAAPTPPPNNNQENPTPPQNPTTPDTPGQPQSPPNLQDNLNPDGTLVTHEGDPLIEVPAHTEVPSAGDNPTPTAPATSSNTPTPPVRPKPATVDPAATASAQRIIDNLNRVKARRPIQPKEQAGWDQAQGTLDQSKSGLTIPETQQQPTSPKTLTEPTPKSEPVVATLDLPEILTLWKGPGKNVGDITNHVGPVGTRNPDLEVLQGFEPLHYPRDYA